jgi:hypothetical protein
MAVEQYLTPAQVADELHVTVVTVRRWISEWGAASVEDGASQRRSPRHSASCPQLLGSSSRRWMGARSARAAHGSA